MGPEGLQEGEELHVALGCQTPIILRRKLEADKEAEGSDFYTYIGQAYVEQLMVYKGDLADHLAVGKVETENRVLI